MSLSEIPFFVFDNIVTGSRDEGIDAGGLTRTVFTYLSKSLFNSIFFIQLLSVNVKHVEDVEDVELLQAIF
jgi:hypothetical protein